MYITISRCVFYWHTLFTFEFFHERKCLKFKKKDANMIRVFFYLLKTR
jgi:hypothetical protein